MGNTALLMLATVQEMTVWDAASLGVACTLLLVGVILASYCIGKDKGLQEGRDLSCAKGEAAALKEILEKQAKEESGTEKK